MEMVPGGEFMDPRKVVGYFGLTPGMRVADFGSGSGDFAILMAKLAGDSGKVTAVDILDTALETLRVKARTEGLGNIETVRSNLEVPGSSGLPNDSEDAVLIANSLFQNSDKQLLLNEAKRILKSSASLIIIEWKKGVGSFGPPDDLRISEEDMKRFAEGSGFQFSNSFDAGAFHYGIIFKKL